MGISALPPILIPRLQRTPYVLWTSCGLQRLNRNWSDSKTAGCKSKDLFPARRSLSWFPSWHSAPNWRGLSEEGWVGKMLYLRVLLSRFLPRHSDKMKMSSISALSPCWALEVCVFECSLSLHGGFYHAFGLAKDCACFLNIIIAH